MKSITNVSTGIAGLDKILNNLQLGDNVVWQVDAISDYLHFVKPYINKALEDNRKIVYFRFADHEPLISNESRVQIYNLNA
jgi:pyruvate,water dikinase